MTTNAPLTNELFGPNAGSVEAFVRCMERTTLVQLRSAYRRRTGADYSAENAAHVACLGLAHRHERLAALEAARLFALRAAAGAIAAAMVEATVERIRGAPGGGVELDDSARIAEAKQEADDLCQVLLEAAELATEALVVRDLLSGEQFGLLTLAFAEIVASSLQ